MPLDPRDAARARGVYSLSTPLRSSTDVDAPPAVTAIRAPPCPESRDAACSQRDGRVGRRAAARADADPALALHAKQQPVGWGSALTSTVFALEQ